MIDAMLIRVPPGLDEVLLTTNELAKRWSYSPASIANMRSKGKGPRFYRLANGDIRYPDWAVFDYELGKVAA
jgi:hypothetical protein